MLKNGLYNVIPGLFRAGLSFISIPVLIRLMGLEEYGVWALVSSVLSFIVLAEAGLPVSATVFVSQDLAKKDEKGLSQTLTITVGAMLLLATFATLLLAIGAEALVSCFPKLTTSQQQTVVQSLQIGAVAVWAQLLNQVFIGIEQAYQQYKMMSVLNTLQWVFCIFGWIFLAWFGGKTLSLAQWQTGVSLASLLSHIWVLSLLTKGQNIRPILNKKKAVEIVSYTLVSWITTLGRAFFTKGDRLIVGSFLGPIKLGIYSSIFEITSAINFFSSIIIQPLIPTISHLLAEENLDKLILQNKVKQAVKLNSFVATFIGIILLVFAREIVNIIMPEAFNQSNVLAFRIVVFMNTIFSLNATGYWILFSMKNSILKSAINLFIFGILSLVLIAVGSAKFGLWGGILGNSGYIGTLLLPIIAMKQLNIPYKLLGFWLIFPLSSFLGVSILTILFLS
ncbi:oligosaccharide flippase family protein [Tolypothrix sp. PCC 7910]|uniref:oligosaccharide flippase family protein n=1 Tax=Tolypothrix sp. PCC 7910 TaxID=2099387 RepID=UPI00142775C4|nr:oligosaccharide flippase family protein [Tolypothrix sp. PCC 7910]QIR39572.1 oligosaccharide flippase family protein [Tolypothrix sp. PCC 7910]